MRQAATILLAVIVGAHCGAPAPSETREDETTVPPPSVEHKPQVDPPPSSSWEDEEVDEIVVTSHADGDDGATYVTGTFSRKIVLGDRKFMSRGEDDVFLARIERNGEVGWARVMGSFENERAPHVEFDQQEKRVKVTALTRGEVDCGLGPMATWSSAMFFYCAFGAAEGEVLASVTMPTGEP